MSKQEVIKPSWIIHISHNLTLVQQQVWNVLLAYAYDNLLTKDIHKVDVRLLFDYVGKTRNISYLKNVLKSLYETETYNLIHKTCNRRNVKSDSMNPSSERGTFSLLEWAGIEDGYCKYTFCPKVISQLVNPVPYATINLLTQSKFTSKYSLILYELCIDYSGIECTPAFTIDDLKIYMGIELHEYEEFKHFNYKIIKKAVAEVNAVSELVIAPQFSTKEDKTMVVFTIKKKPRTSVNVEKIAEKVMARPAPIQTQRCPFKQLKEYGVSEQKTREIFASYSEQEVRDALTQLQKNIEQILNPAAWLVKLLSKKHDDTQTFKPARSIAKQYDTSSIDLYVRHKEYIACRLKEELDALSEDREDMLKIAFEKWMAKNNFTFVYTGSQKTLREIFLIQSLLCPQEWRYEEWVKHQK